MTRQMERLIETVPGRVFRQMLWLNPSDNQGVRLLVEDVRAGKACQEERDHR
ncbi:MAG: hypothetical protein ACREMB_00830 [Candidatus Rokuibacteriota bacterium]